MEDAKCLASVAGVRAFRCRGRPNGAARPGSKVLAGWEHRLLAAALVNRAARVRAWVTGGEAQAEAA